MEMDDSANYTREQEIQEDLSHLAWKVYLNM